MGIRVELTLSRNNFAMKLRKFSNAARVLLK